MLLQQQSITPHPDTLLFRFPLYIFNSQQKVVQENIIKMPFFTPEMEEEYFDLLDEADRVTEGATNRRAYMGTIWMLRNLYESDPDWMERTPECFATLRHTWIMTTVAEIAGQEGGDQWLKHQCEREDLQHQQKTPERMAETASISGLARVMFTSTATKRWISPWIKAYWYALAWETIDEDLDQESTTLSSGHHVTVFPLFPEAA